MDCTICGQPVALSPSAEERAGRSGRPATSFTSLFDAHAACLVAKRGQDTTELIRRRAADLKAAEDKLGARLHPSVNIYA